MKRSRLGYPTAAGVIAAATIILAAPAASAKPSTASDCVDQGVALARSPITSSIRTATEPLLVALITAS
jgi:hypothetical protein